MFGYGNDVVGWERGGVVLFVRFLHRQSNDARTTITTIISKHQAIKTRGLIVVSSSLYDT